jgi:hypothetical protein
VRFNGASRSQKCPTDMSYDAPDRLLALCIIGLDIVVFISVSDCNGRRGPIEDPWV